MPTFELNYLNPDSDFVESIWYSQSEEAGSFTSIATTRSEMVFTLHQGVTTLYLRGPETKATVADAPANAEFFGITFKLGVFIPDLPPVALVDQHPRLPLATKQSFWLGDQTIALPQFSQANDFIQHLERQKLIRYEPLVDTMLLGQLEKTRINLRTLQRRFQYATGLSHRTVKQIERARIALGLLESGVPIFDVIDKLGFTDQPHLTKTLKERIGLTPAQITRLDWMHSQLSQQELSRLELFSR
jgi:AraC-like DNA-binding protein